MSDRDKLDSHAKYLLSTGVEETAGGPIGVMVRGRAAFSGNDLAMLEEDGARIRTVAGDILTADIRPEELPRITAHDFVVSVEMSRPLYPETPGTPGAPGAPGAPGEPGTATSPAAAFADIE